MQKSFKIQCINGKIDESDLRQLVTICDKFSGQLSVTVKPVKKARSLSQNSYYWGVIIPHVIAIFMEHGDAIDSEEAHGYLLDEVGHFGRIIHNDGFKISLRGSTRGLKTGEFEDYMTRCRAWCATWGNVIVPLPNEDLG